MTVIYTAARSYESDTDNMDVVGRYSKAVRDGSPLFTVNDEDGNDDALDIVTAKVEAISI